MKRIVMALVSLGGFFVLSAQPPMLGDMKTEEFRKINEKGNQLVAALKPDTKQLTDTDKALLMEIANGGMRQLEMSRHALRNGVSGEIALLAQSEVEEQSGISAKLHEFAAAKGVLLPAGSGATGDSSGWMMDSTHAGVAARDSMKPGGKRRDSTLSGKSAGTVPRGDWGNGAGWATGDKAGNWYLTQSGIKGHELLEATMKKVNTRASDPFLKGLAAATLPVIRTHLKVSRSIRDKGKKTDHSNAGSGNDSN